MAISNAQQAKQLLQDGGMLVKPRADGKRPGYRGIGGYQSGKSEQASTGDKGDAREQYSVAQTLGTSPTTQSELGIEDKGTPEQNINQREQVRAGRIRAIEKFIDRPKVGFTDAATINLLSPRSILSYFEAAPTEEEDDEQGQGDGQQNIFLPALAKTPTTVEPELTELQKMIQGTPRYRFMNKGGIADTVVGGEFDFETARQAYGLGKLVKKITRTVKKVAKSPIGKAALLYAGGTYLGGLKAFGGTGFGSGNFLANLRSGQGISNLFNFGKAKFLSKPLNTNLLSNLPSTTVDRLATQAAKTAMGASSTGSGLGIGAAITAVSLLPLLGLGTGEESEEEAEALIRGEGLDIDAIRADPNKFTARRFRAEGGSMKEPVAKKTMPLLDMGGKEKDYRETGGFVDMGRMEKADDVPARLSKNEFVFTADAVRNAGDGSVDKGAEVMYNMMKNLEAGGEVSEESQGLEGARKMFQTSQRLEEVL